MVAVIVPRFLCPHLRFTAVSDENHKHNLKLALLLFDKNCTRGYGV